MGSVQDTPILLWPKWNLLPLQHYGYRTRKKLIYQCDAKVFSSLIKCFYINNKSIASLFTRPSFLRLCTAFHLNRIFIIYQRTIPILFWLILRRFSVSWNYWNYWADQESGMKGNNSLKGRIWIIHRVLKIYTFHMNAYFITSHLRTDTVLLSKLPIEFNASFKQV